MRLLILLLLAGLVLGCARSHRVEVASPTGALAAPADSAAREMRHPPPPLAAAEAGSERLDITRAIAIALEHNPDMAVAAERLAAAASLLAAARGVFYPTVSLDVSALRADAPSTYLFKRIDQRELASSTDFNDPGRLTNYEAGITLRWELFRGGGDAAGLGMAREDHELARLGREAVRNELVAAVSFAFHDIISTDELAAAEAAAVETVKAEVAEARTRFEAGAVLKDEVLSLEVRLAEAEDRLIGARNAGRLARAALASLLARDPAGAEGLACADVPPPGVPETYEAGLAFGRAQSPELRAAQCALARARLAVTQATSGYYPTVGVFGRCYHDDERFGFNRNDVNWLVGADITWPIFSGFTTYHRTAAARAGERQAEAALRRAELDLERRVRTAYIQLADAWSRRQVTEAAVARAAETLELVSRRYAAGAETITRYLAAEQDRTGARVSAIRARCSERRARAEVARVLGWWTSAQ
ncbi:MAG: TolC family protein [Planctomycetes bacterium]|nr:TolC family protein [Planctomycetota bacterium]